MDYIQAMLQKYNRITEERMKVEERRIIEGFAVNRQITAEGMSSTIKRFQAAAALEIARRKYLVIANAATAAAIRKQFAREEVEIIITPAVETGTAYIVTDEELKNQLLESIEKGGINHAGIN